jgi:hypothetical protein
MARRSSGALRVEDGVIYLILLVRMRRVVGLYLLAWAGGSSILLLVSAFRCSLHIPQTKRLKASPSSSTNSATASHLSMRTSSASSKPSPKFRSCCTYAPYHAHTSAKRTSSLFHALHCQIVTGLSFVMDTMTSLSPKG